MIKDMKLDGISFESLKKVFDSTDNADLMELFKKNLDSMDDVNLGELLKKIPYFVAIDSVAFPGVYLRLDGRGVTQSVGDGGGKVNCQYGAGPWEKFKVEFQADRSIAFASVAFPGVYLRLDGRGVTQSVGDGGGKVNCQYGAGSWEKFRLIFQKP